MNRKSSIGAVLLVLVLLSTACGRGKKPVVVGSKDTAEQAILAEVVAQHLEHRLEHPVIRNFNLGNSTSTYQAFTNNQMGIYPEDTGTIQAIFIKESHSLDASATLDRVRSEMRRRAQAELMDPLGIDDSWNIAIPKDVAEKNKIETLSDAAAMGKPGWKIGVTRDFNQRPDGLSTLNQYRLPMGAMTYVGDTASLYDLFQKGSLTMVVGHLTDGWLARHDNWTALRDDKKVFGYYQTCLMAREDLLASDPKIQPALAELTGKITNIDIRKLAAQVAVDHKKPADVAAEFLSQAGLK